MSILHNFLENAPRFDVPKLAHFIQQQIPSLGKEASMVLESSALQQLVSTQITNAPYTFLTEEIHLDWEITHRSRYVECAFSSGINSVYNFAMSLVFSTASLVTLGKYQEINDLTERYWIHTGLALASAVISVVGVFSGQAATAMTGSLGYATIRALAHLHSSRGEELINPEFFSNLMQHYGEDVERGIIVLARRYWIESDETVNSMFQNRIRNARSIQELTTLIPREQLVTLLGPLLGVVTGQNVNPNSNIEDVLNNFFQNNPQD